MHTWAAAYPLSRAAERPLGNMFPSSFRPSNYPCYVGIILGKAAWVRGNYPGIRRQAEVATRDEVDSSQ